MNVRKQKAVLITGVLGGIGSALAVAFKNEGYYVYGLDIRSDDKFNCDLFLQFDIASFCSDQDYRRKWEEIFEVKIDTLDVLINNAAVQKLDRLDDLLLKDWQETLNVNLTGPLLLSQYFLDKLEHNRGGIINIASIHQILTKPRFISYATSKSALVGLTKSLAVDLEGRVRVNSISPAAIATEMLIAGFDGNAMALDDLNKIHPVKRIGYPDEVAKMAIFLASENTGFINGANLTLDGGISSVLKDL